MSEIALDAEPRQETGSAHSRRLRALDRIPAVVYGHASVPVAVSVDGRTLRHALSEGAGSNTLFELHLGGERHLAIARELQHHPVRHSVSHVDFLIVSRDEVVSAEVPLVLVGEATEVLRAGGIVEQVVQQLAVRARPGDLPATVELDVAPLTLGGTLHVSDLPPIPRVEVELDPDTVLVSAPVPHGVSVSGEAEGGEGAVEASGSAGGAAGAAGEGASS